MTESPVQAPELPKITPLEQQSRIRVTEAKLAITENVLTVEGLTYAELMQALMETAYNIQSQIWLGEVRGGVPSVPED